MDNAEKSPRGPARGSFDTASLLAPSTTVYSAQSSPPVRSPLPHLAHSPSAFSVLGRNAVLVPPPSLPPPPPSHSVNSDSPSVKPGAKMCSPIMHQSASDALSSLASSSSSGSCGWWSAAAPIPSTTDFSGCGVSHISHPFGRAGMCGRPPSPHLRLPQPRRIVEEVLGHLYAKPASAELKAEAQHSGIHESQQLQCKTAILSPPDFQSTSHHNSSSGLSPEKDLVSSKSETVSIVNNIQPSLLPGLQTPVNSAPKFTSQKPDGVKETNSGVVSSSAKPAASRRKKAPKEAKLSSEAKNEKKPRGAQSRSKPQSEKKQKVAAKAVSSDSEGHMDTSSSGGAGGGPGAAGETSSGGTTSSGSSDSTDDEEREKQQQELARLKKQQKELRRKVQELKQAAQESSHQKSKKSSKVVSSSSRAVNHAKKPVPSPAHASSTLTASPKLAIPKSKLNLCTDDDPSMSVPLDLCVKKQEPTFEVTTSSYLSSLSSTVNSMKKQLQTAPPPFGPQTTTPVSTTAKLPASAPRKRGRKPKYMVPGTIPPEMAHQLKQNSIKDINNLLLPQKMMPTPPPPPIPPSLPPSSRNSESSSLKKSANPGSVKPCLPPPAEVPNPISVPKKNFTLDSLLAESNGTAEPENRSSSSAAAVIVPSSSSPSPSSTGPRSSKSKERNRYSNRIKKVEEPSQDADKLAKQESSSATDSDPDNEHTDSDESASESVSTSTGHKRTYDEDSEELSGKRRRVIPDEREIQIPLEHGWRRETKIRCFSRAGVRGEVIYYTPCGKKLRSYPEVVRYLIKNGITDINRDNFTFSTKVNVGDFLEATGPGEEYVRLSEQEVVARINEVRARKGRLGVQNRRSTGQKSAEQEEQQRQWEQKQLQHQLEQQEMIRQAREAKILRQIQREQALIAARNEKKLRAEEARRQKEQQRMIKQQERFERLEQLRIEREIRAQQALEEQEMKRQQAFLREQEMQKRREMLLMVDLERERRRQHMMLVRALETRKKQEERERKREEILYEKRINREKKMEQRRMELDYLRELKKPVEDMMLKDNVSLPTFNRIPGVKLAGKAFADLLMVFEFLHNFGETLGFDPESLPNLNTLQMAVLNMNDKVEEELLSVVHHLLVCAIEDPGVPHCSEAATVLGQNLKDADITNNNVSEVLRLYFTAQNKRSPMCQLLQAKPFLSLNATQKTEILAHLCDDLLGSRVLMRKIDSNIENVNTLRKDKWLIEGDLRRLKTVQQRRLLKEKQLNYEESKMNQSTNSNTAADSSNTQKEEGSTSAAPSSEAKEPSTECEKEECDKEKIDDLDNDNESGNESDDTQAQVVASDGEDEDLTLSNEELTKKVEKLTKQLTSYSNKLTKALHTIRAVTFGQDRYHRRYWVLPKSGGVFVESMESSELPDERERIFAACSATDEASKEAGNEDDATVKKDGDPEGTKETSEAPEDKDASGDTKGSLLQPEEKAAEQVPAAAAAAVAADSAAPSPKENSDAVLVKKEVDHFPGDGEKDMVPGSEVPKDEPDSKPEAPSKQDARKAAQSRDNLKKGEECMDLEPSLTTPSVKNEVAGVKMENSAVQDTHNKVGEKFLGDEAPEKKPEVNIFMPKFCDTPLGLDSCPQMNHSLHDSSDRKHSPNPSMPSNQNWLLHSPFFASLLAGNMLFNGPVPPGRETNGTYFNLPKNDSNNPFGPFLGLQPGLLSPEQLFKSLSDKPTNPKPWFSILPRMPCDEDSLPKTQPSSKTCFNSSTVYTSPNPFMQNPLASSSPTKLTTPPMSHSTPPTAVPTSSGNRPLSNLQMEILNGVPPGFFLHPFLPHQFGPTYQSNLPPSCSSPSPFTPSPSHSAPLTDFTLNLGRPPASSTPSSIPTPTATPGPSSTGCATPTYRDSPTPSIKRLMMEKMTQEYERPRPIPLEFQKGWWRVTDPGQIKDLVNSLHHRGIREKMLQKHLQKHFNYACASCSQGQDDDISLEVTDLDKEISELPGGAPAADDTEMWSRDVALRLDLAILEQIENLEEKIDGASMQVKGWKPPAKLSTESISKFIPACELYRVRRDICDSPKEKSPKKSNKKISKKKRMEAKKRAMEAEAAEAEARAEAEADLEEKTDDVSVEAGKDTEETAKESEPVGDKDGTAAENNRPDDKEMPNADDKERVSAEGMLTDDKEKTGTSEKDESVTDAKEKHDDAAGKDEECDILEPPPGKINPVEAAKERLLMVESAIERRYLKPPLGLSSNDLSRSLAGGICNPSSSDHGEEEVVPTGLLKWRNSVQSCRSASQLAMCLNYLENYTAWDKSIMRASCQFCHSGENEEMLLLCDGCDKGYHTYCFKPKMEKIPEGDWYCYECLNKATGDNVCVICGKKGKLLDCSSCPKCFHLSCLDMSKMPKGRWLCSGCSMVKPKKSSKKSSSSAKDKERDKESKETPGNKKPESTSQPSKAKANEKKDRKEKSRGQTEDLTLCSVIIDEMEKHDDSWPFLAPVNTKQFPTYRKVIKKPMDLATVRTKLESNQYRIREEFAADVRLIFDNCETFNEDDSPVGQAGHAMRAFFDSRWAELTNT